MKKFIVFITLSVLMTSCVATKIETRSPQEVKMMTTKQFEVDKNLAFKAAISLLQSASFMVEDANKDTGLIRAYKREENKNAAKQRFWSGNSVDAFLTKVIFYIEDLNPELTEVKITIYDGKLSTRQSASYSGGSLLGAVLVGASTQEMKDQSENMVYDPEVYASWFNEYRAEIERRKALTE